MVAKLRNFLIFHGLAEHNKREDLKDDLAIPELQKNLKTILKLRYRMDLNCKVKIFSGQNFHNFTS